MFSVKEMAVRMADTHKVCSNREREPRDVMIESLDRSGKANDKRILSFLALFSGHIPIVNGWLWKCGLKI